MSATADARRAHPAAAQPAATGVNNVSTLTGPHRSTGSSRRSLYLDQHVSVGLEFAELSDTACGGYIGQKPPASSPEQITVITTDVAITGEASGLGPP